MLRTAPVRARNRRSRWVSIAAGNSDRSCGRLDEQRGVEVADHAVGPVAEQPQALVDQADLVVVEELRHGVRILVVLPHDPSGVARLSVVSHSRACHTGGPAVRPAGAAEDRPMRTRTATTAALVLALVGERRPGRPQAAPGTSRAPPAPSSPRTTTGTRTSAGCPCTRAAPRGSRTCRRPDGCTPTSARRTASSRCPTASRSPSSTASHPKVPGGLRLRRRERPGGLPARRRHPDRGRRDGRRRPARDRGRHAAPAGSTRRSSTYQRADGRWTAGSGATWSLTSNKLRPQGWTSADAAGLPILPGLLRYAEVKARPGGPRHPVHHRRDRPAARLAGPARRRIGQRPVVPADGCAVPAQGGFPISSLPRRHPGGAARRCAATGWCSPTTARPGTSRAPRTTAGRAGCSTSSRRSRRRRSWRSTPRRCGCAPAARRCADRRTPW